MKTITAFLTILLLSNFLNGQSESYGTVTDSATGDPMIGVNIIILETKQGTTTDVNGKYRIQNDGKTLQFSYVGHPSIIIENASGKLNVKFDTPYMTGCGIIISDKRIKSAHNYTLLKIEDLNLQNQSDLTPILNTSPGVFMHSGALNTNRIVIRGIGSRSPFSTNKIKAYLDDIPLTNGSGETTIEDIDLSFIKNIEIWKGPTSSRFGAGLGGAIVMNSDMPQQSYFSVHQSLGEFGLQRNTVNLHLQNKKGPQLHLNHNLTSHKGYRDNNEYQRQGLTLLSSHKVDQNNLKVLINLTRLKAFIPSSLNETDFREEPTKAAFTWGRVKGFENYDRLLTGISYKQNLNRKVKLNYSFFLNNKDAYELRPFNILTEKSLSMGGRTFLNWIPNQKLSFRIGTEFFRESYDWETFATNEEGQLLNPLSINTEKRLYANISAEAIYQIDLFKINAGLNLNTTKYDLKDRFSQDSIDISGDYSFDPIASPRLTFTYSPRLNRDYYLLVSHGFSPPTLEETLNPDGRINSDIQPETAFNFEVGTRSFIYSQRLRYELTVYQMWVSNLLVARRTGLDQYIGINAGKTTHKGLEVQASYDFFRKERKKLQLQLSYSFSDFTFTEFDDGDQDFSGNKLTGIPPHQINSVLSGSFFGFYGNLNFVYVSEQPLRDDNSIYSNEYHLLHGKIGYQFSVRPKWHFDIYAGANNLLDARYASMHQINAGSFGGAAPRYFYPGLPRHFYGGVKIKWSFGK